MLLQDFFEVEQVDLPIPVRIQTVCQGARTVRLGNDRLQRKARLWHQQDRILVQQGRQRQFQSAGTTVGNDDLITVNEDPGCIDCTLPRRRRRYLTLMGVKVGHRLPGLWTPTGRHIARRMRSLPQGLRYGMEGCGTRRQIPRGGGIPELQQFGVRAQQQQQSRRVRTADLNNDSWTGSSVSRPYVPPTK